MDLFLDILAGTFLILGCLMSLGAAIGIVRFPDVLSRLHPGAKPQVFGLFLLLAGIGCVARSWALIPALVLAWTLQILAVPVSSHMVGRSGFRNRHFTASSLTVNELADLVERMNREEQEEEAPAQASDQPRDVDAEAAGLGDDAESQAAQDPESPRK